jgi:hypothetical protein
LFFEILLITLESMSDGSIVVALEIRGFTLADCMFFRCS